MKKFVLNFFVVAAMIFSAALVSSCDKDDPKDDECETCDVCIDEPCEHDPCEHEPCDCEEADVFFTVKFISDGVVANEFSVADGSKLTAPVLAPKAGFTFGGWYKDDDFVNAWNFASDVVGVDIALHAKWIVRDVVYLLSEYVDVDGDVMKFEYDDQNRITKMTTNNYYTGDLYSVSTLSYNNAGDLTSVLRSIPDYPLYDQTITFSKSGNIITVTNSQWNEDDDRIISEKIELNAQGLPSKITYEIIYDDGDWYKEVATIKYQGKNLIEYAREEIRVWNGETDTGGGKATMTYDDKKAPLYHCKSPEWFLILEFIDYCGIQNNILTVNSDWNSATYEYTYTYNDDGFPLTRTGTSDTETWTETYKYVNNSGTKNAVVQNETPRRSNVDVAPPKRELGRDNRQILRQRVW